MAAAALLATCEPAAQALSGNVTLQLGTFAGSVLFSLENTCLFSMPWTAGTKTGIIYPALDMVLACPRKKKKRHPFFNQTISFYSSSSGKEKIM